MTRCAGLLIALLLIPTSFPTHVLAQSESARGLDFRTHLSIGRGMTEGEVVAIAGTPDMAADQGVLMSNQGWSRNGDHRLTPERAALSLRTYTYLPVADSPYTTTITFLAGRVTEVQRERKY